MKEGKYISQHKKEIKEERSIRQVIPLSFDQNKTEVEEITGEEKTTFENSDDLVESTKAGR